MNKNKQPLSNEVPKYKKKSNKTYQKRSNHKHRYETVMLFRTLVIRGELIEFSLPTEVCSVCGRIGHIDPDPSYYEEGENNKVDGQLSHKGLALPQYIAGYFDKVAKRKE